MGHHLQSNPIDRIDPVAEHMFGTNYLLPYQRLVITNILEAAEGVRAPDSVETDSAAARSRQIAVLPTGSGKSLCFQLPAAILSGTTVVIYPLLSLIADQERRMRNAGLRCAAIRGGQTSDERRRLVAKARAGELDLVLTSPESLDTEAGSAVIHDARFVHAVIDEAHCISQWGRSFRPAYLKLGSILEKAKVPTITAFTATATDEILADIDRYLFQGRRAHRITAFPDRPELRFHVVQAPSSRYALVTLLRHGRPEPAPDYRRTWRYGDPLPRPAIVFCNTRSESEQTARFLRSQLGERAIRFYHAGLDSDERADTESWFFDAENAVLCATTAYGMGVDKSNVRSVVHTEPHGTYCSYVQETGRAGRDRKPADAVLVLPTRSLVRVGDSPSPLLSYALGSACRRQVLLGAFGAHCDLCGGCDICCGTNPTAIAEASALHALASEACRRLSSSACINHLTGEVSRPALRRVLPGYGALATWSTEAVGEFLDAIRTNLNERKKRKFW